MWFALRVRTNARATSRSTCRRSDEFPRIGNLNRISANKKKQILNVSDIFIYRFVKFCYNSRVGQESPDRDTCSIEDAGKTS